jgi:hypothetical protein
MAKITVEKTLISVIQVDEEDFISLTDIAKFKSDDPSTVIGNWMRNRNTIEYLGIWETLNNPEFKPFEFEGFRRQAGLNAFVLSPQKWVEATGARGIISRSGRNGVLLPIKILPLNLQAGFPPNLSCILYANSSD